MTQPVSSSQQKTHPLNTARVPIDILADDFVGRFRAGEFPAISDYVRRYPDLAEEIRELFPTLVLLEKQGQQLSTDSDGDPPARIPEKLGHYRVIGEIGRGGMGVVYEAEHEKMERRVAIKILPTSVTHDQVQRQRFFREACIAGRLHHSNIVPIFEVGSEEGLHFYAMQFIRGQNLDHVLGEIRRLRAHSASPPRSASEQIRWLAGSRRQDPLSPRAAILERSCPLFAASELPHTYFDRVAQIGLQVAEAMDYAHHQSILHRDIKPSNIILDDSGTAWITDFGLAKGDANDLTRSGDILGTFRYMAPERFDGRDDARSDIYGLGLTLYELCTLQDAFSRTDRAKLVKDICENSPPRPRKVRPEVPRDLETIILKATEKQPQRRYATAGQLAEDLHLFLADRPIRARRTTVVERLWRWGRRNPLQAILCVAVVLLMCTVTIEAVRFGYVTSQQSQQLKASEQVAEERLYMALRKGAVASRWSGRPGQHYASLDDLSRARELLPRLGWHEDVFQRELGELRNSAIAAMVLTDLRSTKSWSLEQAANSFMCFSSDYSAYARPQKDGAIVVHRTHNDEVWARLPAPLSNVAVDDAAFSSDQAFLAASYRGNGRSVFRVWSMDRAEDVLLLDFANARPLHFALDEQRARAVLANGRHLRVFDLLTGQQLSMRTFSEPIAGIGVNPQDGQIGLTLGKRDSLYTWLPMVDTVTRYELPMTATTFQWHPFSGDMVVGGNSGRLLLLRLSHPVQKAATFVGHTGRINAVHLSPDAKLMASEAWDGTLRLWEVTSGKQLLRAEGLHLLRAGFRHSDARYLAARENDSIHLLQIAQDVAVRVFRSEPALMRRWSVDIHPSGRWLLTATDAGTELWDIERGKLIQFLPATLMEDGTSKDACFLAASEGLVTSNADGVRFYPMEFPDGFEQPPTIQAPRQLHVRQATWISTDAMGKRLAFRDGVPGSMARLLEPGNLSTSRILGPHPGLDHVQLSPDGRWIATATWGGNGGVCVWDVQTGTPVTVPSLEPTEPRTDVTFSWDSQRLATSSAKGQTVWEVGSWKPIFRIERATRDDWPGPLAFSPDGQFLAVAHSRFKLALLDGVTGERLALLDGAEGAGLHDCSFSHDGRFLAAALDNAVQVWDLNKIQQRLDNLNLGFSR